MESTGAGHRRAAEAIQAVLRREHPTIETRLVNIVDHMNETLHGVYQRVRNWLMDDAPHVFGQLYAWADTAPDEKDETLERILLGIELSSLRSLLTLMRTEACDLAIHTHFFPNEVSAYLRRKGEISVPHVTVTTDYFSHALWSHTPCERFFVASRDAATYLNQLGVPHDHIIESGIPIAPEFDATRRPAHDFEHETARRVEDMRADRRRPHVLLSMTGTGPETAAHTLRDLLAARRPLDVTVLAGGNAERKEQLEAVPQPSTHEVRILGMRDDMPQLLSAADVVIGKAGGLTSSEAMAMGCPLALLSPRPDQEEQNADYLLEKQAALRIFRSSLLGPKIDELFGDLERWGRLRRSAYGLGRPRAAWDVVERSLALIPSARDADSAG